MPTCFKNFLTWVVICFAGASLSLMAVQAVVIGLRTKKVSYNNIPFERKNPHAKLKILFLGDSTALGTGAMDNTQSVAGWFGRDFPEAEIINRSRNGKRIKELADHFPFLEE